MKAPIIKALAIMATVTSVASISEIQHPTVANAATTTNTAKGTTSNNKKEEAYKYKQNIADLKQKINNKLKKLDVTNSTTEKSLQRLAESCIRDDDEYSIDIDSFDKDSATRTEEGSIDFDIIIEDIEGNETILNETLKIPVIGTNVYRKLPELNKYAKVKNKEVIDDVLNGKSYDKTKYYVSNEGVPNEDIVNTGWLVTDKGRYYISEDKGVYKGWAEIEGKQYHFDETTGIAKIGWEYHNNRWYFMGQNGEVLTGFRTIDNITYYLNPAYTDSSTVIYTTDLSYMLPTIGSMATGWKQIEGKWYYFNGSGAMQKGWQSINGTWYYFDTSGQMKSNTDINGYHLDSNGAWDPTWVKAKK